MFLIWLTSDLHLNHQNILKYEAESRPFATVQEMNEKIIANHNSVIKPEDKVYILGDLAMGRVEDVKPYLERLNGSITIVRGNHDTPQRIAMYQELGMKVKDIEYLSYKGRYFILCHFPMASKEFIQMVIKDNSEVVNLYGHVHHNAPKGCVDGTYHVGLDTNDLMPISIEQIWQECQKKNEL